MNKFYLIVVAVAALMLQGCLGDDDNYNPQEVLDLDIDTIQEYLVANGIDAVMDTASGIFFEEHEALGGYLPALNGTVKIHYDAFVLDGNRVGGNSAENPLSYNLGSATSINLTPGFDYGISKTGVGDSVTIYVPSVYGYRDIGYALVPPNAILKYVVRFLEIDRLESDLEAIDQYILDSGMSVEIEPLYGTRYVVHRDGTGDSPNIGDQVEVDYIGQLLNGSEFDQSYDGNLFSFTMGQSEVIIGFELGIANLQRFDSATVFIPSTYGYKGVERQGIPPHSVLVFGIEVRNITPRF